METVYPFGSGDARRCAILFEHRASSIKRKEHYIVAQTEGRISASTSFADAMKQISFRTTTSRSVSQKSDYINMQGKSTFRQGATITPRVLTVADSIEKIDVEKTAITTTKSMHLPWAAIDPQFGIVPSAWIRKLMTSNTITPYAVHPKAYHVIVPIDGNGVLERSPDNDFWQRMEELYRQNCNMSGDTNAPKTIMDRIDYASKLNVQIPIKKSRKRKMIIYSSSANAMRACRIHPARAIVDSTLYWYIAETASEAAYLVGLLNATCLTKAFNQSKQSGRSFHLNPWRAIPIPKFNREEPDHVMLAKLVKYAEKVVESWLLDFRFKPFSQIKMSSEIRKLLHDDGVSDEINTVVSRILPQHVNMK